MRFQPVSVRFERFSSCLIEDFGRMVDWNLMLENALNSYLAQLKQVYDCLSPAGMHWQAVMMNTPGSFGKTDEFRLSMLIRMRMPTVIF